MQPVSAGPPSRQPALLHRHEAAVEGEVVGGGAGPAEILRHAAGAHASPFGRAAVEGVHALQRALERSRGELLRELVDQGYNVNQYKL